MGKMFDVIMLGMDMSLIMYLYNVAINTTNMQVRIISCMAMTLEVFFIRRHLRIIKLNSTENKS